MSKHRLSIQKLNVQTKGKNGRALLTDLSLHLTQGKVTALVGASGSGKSTACSASLGVCAPNLLVSCGGIYLDQSPITPEKLRGGMVASIIQNPRSGFNPLRTMKDHLQETMAALSLQWDQGQALKTLQEVGFDKPDRILDLYSFEMSGGMLQRVAVAIALLSRAPFLFADEPTTDLDLVVQARILDLLAKTQREAGLGILLITHDMGVVARLADEVVVLDKSKVVEYAPVDQIFHAPKHPVTRMLISAHLALYGQELSA